MPPGPGTCPQWVASDASRCVGGRCTSMTNSNAASLIFCNLSSFAGDGPLRPRVDRRSAVAPPGAAMVAGSCPLPLCLFAERVCVCVFALCYTFSVPPNNFQCDGPKSTIGFEKKQYCNIGK